MCCVWQAPCASTAQASLPVVVALLAAVLFLSLCTIVLLLLFPQRPFVHRRDKSSATEEPLYGASKDTVQLLPHELLHHQPAVFHANEAMEQEEDEEEQRQFVFDPGLNGAEENSEVGEITHNLTYDEGPPRMARQLSLDYGEPALGGETGTDEGSVSGQAGSVQDHHYVNTQHLQGSHYHADYACEEGITVTLAEGRRSSQDSEDVATELLIVDINSPANKDTVRGKRPGPPDRLPSIQEHVVSLEPAARADTQCGHTDRLGGELPAYLSRDTADEYMEHTLYTDNGPITTL